MIMKIVVVLACLAGIGAAAADDRIRGQTLQVKERLAALEQINVTARKEVDESIPMDDEVAAILVEAEGLAGHKTLPDEEKN